MSHSFVIILFNEVFLNPTFGVKTKLYEFKTIQIRLTIALECQLLDWPCTVTLMSIKVVSLLSVLLDMILYR